MIEAVPLKIKPPLVRFNSEEAVPWLIVLPLTLSASKLMVPSPTVPETVMVPTESVPEALSVLAVRAVCTLNP